MPAKTVICAICGRDVSKRSTLSLGELGGGNGRACRMHDEVVQLVEEKRRAQDGIRAIEQIGRKMRILSAVYTIRWLHTLKGISVDVLYARLDRRPFTPDMIREIREEIDRLGGPLMPEQEILEGMIGAIELSKRQEALGLVV